MTGRLLKSWTRRWVLFVVSLAVLLSSVGCDPHLIIGNGDSAIGTFLRSDHVNVVDHLSVQMDGTGGSRRAITAIKGSSAPTRVVVLVHGATDNADHFLGQTSMDQVIRTHPGWAALSIEGLYDGTFNSGATYGPSGITAFCCGSAVWKNVDDLGFLNRLVTTLRQLGIREVDLVGYSNGGMLAALAECEQPFLFNNVVMVEATLETPSCRYGGAFKALIINGNADRLVSLSGPVTPFAGGLGLLNPRSALLSKIGGLSTVVTVDGQSHAWPAPSTNRVAYSAMYGSASLIGVVGYLGI